MLISVWLKTEKPVKLHEKDLKKSTYLPET